MKIPTTESIEVHYSASDPIGQLHNFAEQLNTTVEGLTAIIPPEIGSGYIRHVPFGTGFGITIIDITSGVWIKAIREKASTTDFYPIIFWLNEEVVEYTIEGETRDVGQHTPSGVFFASPQIALQINITPGIRLFNLTLALSPKWLKDFEGSDRENAIVRLIESQRPFFVYENISPQMRATIDQLFDRQQECMVDRLMGRAAVLQLLAHFIELLNHRHSRVEAIQLDQKEVARIFGVKSKLLLDLSQIPTIRELAREAGMSESKLQRNFKHVFGTSVYQFAINSRMTEAKRLLDSRMHTVSEVGFRVGYTNLSHFTIAFRKRFGLNPKAYLKGQT